MGERKLVQDTTIIENWVKGYIHEQNISLKQTSGETLEIVQRTDPILEKRFTALINYNYVIYGIKIDSYIITYPEWKNHNKTTKENYNKIKKQVKEYENYQLIELNKMPDKYEQNLVKLIGREHLDILPQQMQNQLIAEKL